MNIRLVINKLGIISVLIGGSMLFSLLWAFPALGQRQHLPKTIPGQFEVHGFLALIISIGICFFVGAWFVYLGRGATGQLFRKEAMAVVGFRTLAGPQYLNRGQYPVLSTLSALLAVVQQ